jgi:signal transduction histidine kinase
LIIKEALNNIAKYSEAENVEVNVAVQGTHLTVDISDNGKGFDIHLIKQGNGLSNMKSRAESLHGNLEIVSAPGKGTFIHCLIPLPNISE